LPGLFDLKWFGLLSTVKLEDSTHKLGGLDMGRQQETNGQWSAHLRWLTSLTMLLLVFGLAACAADSEPVSNEPYTQLTSADDKEALNVSDEEIQAASDRSLEFAMDLFPNVTEGGENAVYSPTSIRLAMAMVYAGAAGETKSEIGEAMRFGDGDQDEQSIHATLNALVEKLESYELAEGGTELDDREFNVANAVWLNEYVTLVDTFRELVGSTYGAGVYSMDFGAVNDPTGIINGWVADQTNGLITGLLQDGYVKSNTALVLTNALYLKAPWSEPFEQASTTPDDFHLLSGSTVTAEFMHTSIGNFLGPPTDGSYTEGDGWKAITKPLKMGSLSMAFIMPDEGNFAEFTSEIDAEMVRTTLDSMEQVKTDIALPKFEVSQTIDLNETLETLGVSSAFTGASDFSALTNFTPVSLGDVRHKATIGIDENGVEAAAATTVGVPVSEPPEEFFATRPFYFFIHDRDSGEVLFVGRVMDPS
jgi:serpin B